MHAPAPAAPRSPGRPGPPERPPDTDGEEHPIILPRSHDERLHIGIREHGGHTFADLRLHFRDEEGEWHPTKRGVTVPPRLWGRFLAAVQLVGAEMQRRGLLPDGEDEDGPPS
ncbi:MAG: transcriptional coactivator p15/PC4 family protein [Candidatus Latescibacterota bacterium]